MSLCPISRYLQNIWVIGHVFWCEKQKSSLFYALIQSEIENSGCKISCHKMRFIILSYGAKHYQDCRELCICAT